jgi:CRP/FNR family transcriptional regulator, cyclic AMP receptor protein
MCPREEFAMSSAEEDRLVFPLLDGLAAEDAAAVWPLLHRRTVQAGTTVFHRGDAADAVYLVVSGQFRVSVTSAGGQELSFRIIGPGGMVGEIGVLEGTPRSADLTALQSGELLTLGRGALHSLLQTRTAIAGQIIRFLCRRLRETSEQLEALALARIEVRLARLLLREADGGSTLTLGVSQSEIAALLGASRPKVNGAFAELERQGAIRRDGRTLHCDLGMLSEIAELPDLG